MGENNNGKKMESVGKALKIIIQLAVIFSAVILMVVGPEAAALGHRIDSNEQQIEQTNGTVEALHGDFRDHCQDREQHINHQALEVELFYIKKQLEAISAKLETLERQR